MVNSVASSFLIQRFWLKAFKPEPTFWSLLFHSPFLKLIINGAQTQLVWLVKLLDQSNQEDLSAKNVSSEFLAA